MNDKESIIYVPKSIEGYLHSTPREAQELLDARDKIKRIGELIKNVY